MESITDNLDILNRITDRKKASNIKVHLGKQVKEGKEDDSQVILFKLLIDMNEEIKRLQISLDKKVDNEYYETAICHMKKAIETKERKHITEFEKISSILDKDITEKESLQSELCDNLEYYKDSIGVKVINYNLATNDSAPEYLNLYSRESYIHHMNRLQKLIDNSSGLLTMRLKQTQAEYLKDKKLKIFQ